MSAVGRVTFAHTPGPWTVSALDGRTIGPMRLLTAEGTDVPQLQAVAVVKERTGETEANARLVAAAPDLLAALHELRDILLDGMQGDYDQMTAALGRARAAIAKAEGQQPS